MFCSRSAQLVLSAGRNVIGSPPAAYTSSARRRAVMIAP